MVIFEFFIPSSFEYLSHCGERVNRLVNLDFEKTADNVDRNGRHDVR